LRWIGAGQIPSRHFGYWQATIPLVQVRLVGECLTIRIQPRWLGRLVGAESLTAVPADGVEARLVRDNATWQGIEFKLQRQTSFYFFTSQRAALLAALSQAGFTVNAQPRGERS
jgi:hypothetical protein